MGTKSIIYNLIKRIYDRGNYDADNLFNKLNVYYALEQISSEEYEELMILIKGCNTEHLVTKDKN